MNKYILKIALATLYLIVMCACKDNENEVRATAGIFNLSRAAYTAADGAKITPPWIAGEETGLTVGNSLFSAKAINSIAGGLKFCFAVPNDKTAKDYCFFYPFSDSFAYSDSTVTTDISHQNGSADNAQFCAGIYNGMVTNAISEAPKVELSPLLAIIKINISAGIEAKIAKVEFKGNNNEKTGGKATIDLRSGSVSCTESSNSISFDTPLDVSSESANVYMAVAPGLYTKGFTITVTDKNGESNSTTYASEVNLAIGTVTSSAGKLSYTELAFIGSTNVYIINADNSVGDDLDVLWHWDSSNSDIPSSFKGMFIHCDDAKSVDNGTKILVTSSATTGGCALIDRETQKCLFYARCNNAHSAALLPNDRIAVAASTGTADRNNSVLIFDIAKHDVVVCQADLTSAHGVQWIESRQCLYAIGENNLVEYKLENWESGTPSLKVNRIIKTPQSNLHDLTFVSEDELLCAGNNAYIIHLDNLTFDELTQFHGETNVKSVNYNKESGIIWATIAEESWWTFHIQEFHVGSKDTIKTLSAPFTKYGTNIYKCRVYQW